MTEIGESVSVTTIKDDPDKYLKVEVLEVDFIDTFITANEKKEVVAPHWPSKKYRFIYSQKPAVLKIGRKSKASIKVKVDSKGANDQGILRGSIKGYAFEGKMPLSSGERTVTVTLKEPPDSTEWLKGPMLWEVDGGDLNAVAGSTYVELFFVFDDPSKLIFFSKGVWAEALRFLFEKGRIRGIVEKNDAVKKITRFCINNEHHKYDIKNGAPQFGGASKKFKLSKYIKPKGSTLNCYDQTYAVVVFSGALAIKVDGLFMNPFGFLNATHLVGYGKCNNPFPEKKYNSEVKRSKSSLVGKAKLSFAPPKVEDYLFVDIDDIDRAPFGNHMFCEYKNRIFDSCAGPAIGSGDRKDYIAKNVDAKTTLNSLYGGFPGKEFNVKGYSLVGANVLEVL